MGGGENGEPWYSLEGRSSGARSLLHGREIEGPWYGGRGNETAHKAPGMGSYTEHLVEVRMEGRKQRSSGTGLCVCSESLK